jgi:hypothetical protein
MAAYFCATVGEFLQQDPLKILGELNLRASEDHSTQLASTVISWKRTLTVLKDALTPFLCENERVSDWGLLLEYDIPRRDRRIDAVLLAGELIIILEFKTGESGDEAAARRQVEHYALDLHDFHRESRDRILVPVVVNSGGSAFTPPRETNSHDPVREVLCANDSTLQNAIRMACDNNLVATNGSQIDVQTWNRSGYEPVPSIVEAAQMLFAKHDIRELSHSYADNLTHTTDFLISVVERAQRERRKSICFVTGVPGAGKTLAGLNVLHCPQLMHDERPFGAFLSGNIPLVKVLLEALAQNYRARTSETLQRSRHVIRTSIQNVHGFLKEYRRTDATPPEHVIIFDEAQRAWDALKVGKKDRQRASSVEASNASGATSEPQMMLQIMDRWDDWAVVIALVGGGQEIHDGEAGLAEGGRAVQDAFSHWDVCVSREALEGGSSVAGSRLFETAIPTACRIQCQPYLHLSVSNRSYRAQAVASWVNAVVAGSPAEAASIASEITEFPLKLTRSLSQARDWLRRSTRGYRRCGLLASSGALRLRADGIEVSSSFRHGIKIEDWFLASPDDIRSSNALEVAFTEFEVQGLELDWVGVCWGGDFTWSGTEWTFRRLNGPTWKNVRNATSREFIRNKYRVLLTRAREGMVIWIPSGDSADSTRLPSHMDRTADFLCRCGAAPLT